MTGVRRALAIGVAFGFVTLTAPAHGGSALVDLADSAILDEVDGDAAIAPDAAADLLLVAVVCERIASGVLEYESLVPIVAAPRESGAAVAGQKRLRVGELLQLLLLGGSRSAAMSLAGAVGPGADRARSRMRHAAARLGLRGTIVSDGSPAPATDTVAKGRAAAAARAAATPPQPASVWVVRTTVHDVAVLAATIAANAQIRRRLALDGAPIADGASIVRATAPLITLTRPRAVTAATTPPRTRSSAPESASTLTRQTSAAIALATQDGLELLAIASGSDPAADVWQTIDRGFSRFERVQVVRAGQRVVGNVATNDGAVPRAGAITTMPFAVTVRRHGTPSISAWWQLPAPASGPVEPNQPVGELIFEQNGRIIGAVPLVAPGAGVPHRWLDTARR
jgi:D-alanyl-D-alanine carboxypeptidase